MTDVNNAKRLRELAELKAQLEHSETKVSWLLRDNERVVKEKDAEIERLKVELGRPYDKVDRLFEANKKHLETIASQKRVIEKLKRYTQHRVECVYRTGVFQYSNDCDCGLKAIEKEGEA